MNTFGQKLASHGIRKMATAEPYAGPMSWEGAFPTAMSWIPDLKRTSTLAGGSMGVLGGSALAGILANIGAPDDAEERERRRMRMTVPIAAGAGTMGAVLGGISASQRVDEHATKQISWPGLNDLVENLSPDGNDLVRKIRSMFGQRKP